MPQTLRALKKLSKRAAPLLAQLGDTREQFAAERFDNYMSSYVRARKCWERGRSVHDTCIGSQERKHKAADGNGWIYVRPSEHPLKGTVMVGAMSGGEQPEWDEQTAWCALKELVFWHFVEFRTGQVVPTRTFRTPSDYLAGAADILRGSP